MLFVQCVRNRNAKEIHKEVGNTDAKKIHKRIRNIRYRKMFCYLIEFMFYVICVMCREHTIYIKNAYAILHGKYFLIIETGFMLFVQCVKYRNAKKIYKNLTIDTYNETEWRPSIGDPIRRHK